MKSIVLSIALLLFSISSALYSQSDIEGVVVEKYYISDLNDSQDEDGGYLLKEGSTTYRIFIDLVEGAKVRSMFGSAEHPFYITSTDTIWNNNDRGKTFGLK
jgi:hypothetical protein